MRISPRLRWLLLIALAAALGGAWTVQTRRQSAGGPAANDVAEAPRPGFLAPNFSLTTTRGETFTLSELRGQPVVLNFWATWCPPCRIEMPFFENVSRAYAGRVAVVGVSQGEAESTIVDFARERDITYPLMADGDSRVNRLYGVRALPTTLFIDANGVVTRLNAGAINQAVLEENIQRLLGE